MPLKSAEEIIREIDKLEALKSVLSSDKNAEALGCIGAETGIPRREIGEI